MTGLDRLHQLLDQLGRQSQRVRRAREVQLGSPLSYFDAQSALDQPQVHIPLTAQGAGDLVVLQIDLCGRSELHAGRSQSFSSLLDTLQRRRWESVGINSAVD